jgi:hypothetical protein
MAAGIANHRWTIGELIMAGLEFRIERYDNQSKEMIERSSRIRIRKKGGSR